MNKKLFLAIGAILLVAVGVVIGFVLFKDKEPVDEKTAEASITPTSSSEYYEESYKSADVETVIEIMSAAEKVASEAQYDWYIQNGTTFTISAATTGAITLAVANLAQTDDRVEDAWIEIANYTSNVTLSSKAFKANATGNSTVVGTVGKDGNITWAGSGLFAKGKTDKEGDFFTSFSPDFDKRLDQ